MSFVCIHLIIRRLKSFTFSFLTPKSLFLVFWQMWGMGRGFIFRQKNILSSEQWVMSCENIGTSACSVRGFYSRKSRQSRQRLRVSISWYLWDYNPMYSLRTLHADAPTPSPLSAHYSQLKNMSLMFFCQISQLITHYSPLTVKHFYFYRQTAYWCQNEQKLLKIVQKQT